MAKRLKSVQLKGLFDMGVMEIEEATKDSINTYDLKDLLSEFDGKTITISIKEEDELPVKDNE
ncbi:YonK family protein [Fictibacillus nanhaiensis]|uniref:YonK family protein n=1 Tax=Fictibacillus nanhaiensis TaxID=742169 RepID=UPI002E229B00|nr:YonK family protein [Fictibacillus nanhaiensis]